MFSELRKFKVGLILAHQYMHQLDDEIRRAILGNAGTIISFRVGTEDAQFLAKEMYPAFGIHTNKKLPGNRNSLNPANSNLTLYICIYAYLYIRQIARSSYNIMFYGFFCHRGVSVYRY